MVALLDVVHARADLDDLARTLVAQHDRHRPRPVAVDQRQVGVAEPAAAHLDQHLALAGRIEIDLEDMDGLALGERPRRAADGSFHLRTSATAGCIFHQAIPPSTRTSDPVVKLDALEAR